MFREEERIRIIIIMDDGGGNGGTENGGSGRPHTFFTCDVREENSVRNNLGVTAVQMT